MAAIVILLQILTVLLLVLGCGHLFYEWKLGAAPTPSSSAALRAVAKMLPDYDGDEIVDLGSGWGGMTFAAAAACPDKKVVGIEYAWPPYVWSRLRLLLHPQSNLRFLYMDLFKYKFSQKPVVFCYMPPEMMTRLVPKLGELPKGAVVISNSEAIAQFTLEKTVDVPGLLPEKIHVYRV
jgi:16S rRNA A1518/A1519 N6-dimethyltransferase RsmA/KsgA/DIM1 with predicted DNA glycosylase/AP lyase activity